MDKNIYVIENDLIRVSLVKLGASIYDVEIFDGNHFKSVLSTSKHIEDFLNDDMNKGRLIGRTAGKLYYGVIKDSPYFSGVSSNIMHGGLLNFAKSSFDIIKVEQTEITFKHHDVGSLNGYIGNVLAEVTYRVENMSLIIDIKAKSDADTIVNITSHPYFNLSGDKDIKNHNLYVNASKHHSRSDANVLGSYVDVVQGFDDFTTFLSLEQTLSKGVLDHVYLTKANTLQASLCANNIKLNVYSTYPGIVIYSQNRDSKFRLNHDDGLKNIHGGLAIEPQYIQGYVPVLKKGELYTHQIKYELSINLN